MLLRPITLREARGFVGRMHRHNRPPQGGLFAVGCERAGQLVGVAIIGRPIARNLDDGHTCEVTRLCTDGTPNACSLLYGASARAAKALGWSRIVTYTLANEPGTSLRASGWEREKTVTGEKSWSRPSRARVQTDLFGDDERPACAKVRWARRLNASNTKHEGRA